MTMLTNQLAAMHFVSLVFQEKLIGSKMNMIITDSREQ